MGSIGIREIAVVVVLLILVFGAKRLPELARSLGKAIVEFKKGAKDVADQATFDDKDKSEDSDE